MDALTSFTNSMLASGPQDLGLAGFLGGTLLAALCGLVIATIFYFRDRQRADVNAFALSVALFCVFCCDITMIVGSNIARGFGLIGALSIIRFRNSVRSVDDIVFLFWSLCAGMCIGAGFMAYGILFTLLTALIYYLFSGLIFRERETVSAHVTFQISEAGEARSLLKDIESQFKKSGILYSRDKNLSTLEHGKNSVRAFYLLKVPLDNTLKTVLARIAEQPGVQVQRSSGLDGL